MTTKQMIKVMEHFDNGGEVELRDSDSDTWDKISDPAWDWYDGEYRIADVLLGPELILNWSDADILHNSVDLTAIKRKQRIIIAAINKINSEEK